MTPEISVFLDLVRFLAAMIVFIGHVSGVRFTGGFLWQAGPYMGMAVAIFFVLSGVVIGFVTKERETDARIYAVNRLARIYSVALPAIVLTILLDAAGRSLAPALYSADWGYNPAHPGLQIVTALTFTQRLFGADITIGSDLPYWSLNNEVVYYVLFGVFTYMRGVWGRAILLAALVIAAGTPILALFPLWLSGFVFMRLKPWIALPRLGGWALIAAGVGVMAVYEIWSWRNGRPLAAIGPAFRPELAQDYLVAVAFLVVLAGVGAASADLAAPIRLIAPITRWLSARTFSIYLYHLPIAQFLAAVSPWRGSVLIIYVGTLGAVFALAQVTELQKKVWRKVFFF